jgi:hypothetical protein
MGGDGGTRARDEGLRDCGTVGLRGGKLVHGEFPGKEQKKEGIAGQDC